MEGRVDYAALDRSRLLSSGALAGLGPSYSGGETGHTSSLGRYSGGSSGTSAVGVTPSELARAGSPTALQQYGGRFLPTSSLHSPSASYAMMAGYLANPSHIPDSLKHLMPEFQQYWTSAVHSEGYARYLLNNMYYPYLSYLPSTATESLALFAQNSANAAQVQAVIQAQASQHRIYDLQKEALFNHGSLPHGLYPPSHVYGPGGQMEATNLSLPSSSKMKPETSGKEKDMRDARDGDSSREETDRRASVQDSDKTKQSERERLKEKFLEGSERTRGILSKTDDRDKIKGSKKHLRYTTHTSTHEATATQSSISTTEPIKIDLTKSTLSPKYPQEISSKCVKPKEKKIVDENEKLNVERSSVNESDKKSISKDSPQRKSRLVSPDRQSLKIVSPLPDRVSANIIQTDDMKSESVPCVQEMPENLCVKDMKREKDVTAKLITKECSNDTVVSSCVRTQTIVTGTTITVTSTLHVYTSECSGTVSRSTDTKNKDSHSPSSKEKAATSPSLAHSPTMTTYSLPYYHNLYSRSQSFPQQQGKRVHAVTYVPEIGTISSPIAGAPSIIDIVDTKSEQRHRVSSDKCDDTTEPRSDAKNISTSSMRNAEDDTADDTDDSVEIYVCDNDNEVLKRDKQSQKVSDNSTNSNKTEVQDCDRCRANPCKSECVQIKGDCDSDTNSKSKNKKLNSKGRSSNLSPSHSDASDGDSVLKSRTKSSTTNKTPVINETRTEHSNSDDSKDIRNKSINEKNVSVTTKGNVSQSDLRQSVCDMNHNSKLGRAIKPQQNKKGSHSIKSPSAMNLSMKSFDKEGHDKSTKKAEGTMTSETVCSESTSTPPESRITTQIAGVKPIVALAATTAPLARSDTSARPRISSPGSLKIDQHDKSSMPATVIKSSESQVVKSSSSKHSEGQTSSSASGIPVGIAVARQRNIAPKLPGDKEGKKIDEGRGKGSTPDIKHVRPLKIIRPSTTKGSTPTSLEKRNELPANLIVTGGSSTPGVFWPEDPASRQLAAQFLQNGSPITPSTWYGQTSFPFPQNIVTPTTDASHGNQLPLTVPPGYKLAQDSLTGQILLIPAATDVFTSFPVGSQLHQNSAFAASVLPGQPAAGGALSTTSTMFASGQQPLGDRPPNIEYAVPQFPAVYNSSVVASPDVVIKETKAGTAGTVGATPAVVTPSVLLPTGAESKVAATDHLIDKEKVTAITKPTLLSDLGVTQQCTYTFPTPTMPFVFNSSIIPTHTIPDPATDTSNTKHDATTVQSRGTSPMLPATDSSTEECDDYHSQSELKSDDKTDVDTIPDVIDKDTEEEEDVDITESISDDQETKIIVDSIDDNDHENNKKKIADISNTDSEKLDKSLTVDDDRCKANKTVEHKIELEDKEKAGSETQTAEEDTKPKHDHTPRADRNIFTDITEYNPFTDPQVLQAADGLELLSALAEKSSLCSSMVPVTPVPTKTEMKADDTKDDDIFSFKDESPPIKPILKVPESIKHVTKQSAKLKSEHSKSTHIHSLKSVVETNAVKSDKQKPRIRCGHAFLPKLKEETTQIDVPKRVTTFCGITIPEDDDVIDSIELEMKLRLAELQRRYKEKQKELSKLIPKKDKESEKEKASDKSKSSEKSADCKRGPGRPKKRTSDASTTVDANGDPVTPKSKLLKKDVRGDRHSNSLNSSSGSSGGSSGPTKKKKMAEMIVDRVFRKSGSSFRIPLSKKVSLIAPARIELPGISTGVERSEIAQHNKAHDFGKLIKRSRLSQLNGKDRSFVGGLWHKKDDRKKHLSFGSSHLKMKKKKRPKEGQDFSVENGLGLLAEYATKSRDDDEKKKRKIEETPTNSSPDSPNKKRKPGRPKKCDVIRPGVTETIVAKQSKHIDYFRLQTEEPKADRKITLDGKTPLKPLYLDEWNVRRSERIFLSDPSPQTSPNAISPGVKPKLDEKGRRMDTFQDNKSKLEKQKKSRSIDLSQKVKRKYNTGFNQQKSKEKTTELLKASRDRLAMKRQENKKKLLSKTKTRTISSDSDNDDVPLSIFKKVRPITPDPPKCVLEQDSLCDGTRILVFMDGLFHEGELKAIRPPDVYGAILDNERKTRPHYFSQEEILKDAILDVKPTCAGHVKEGTRICAYWSQQFSCLYPGTISRGSPNPSSDTDLFNVEFDDGDTGRIPMDHIRIIPQDFPIVDYDPNPFLLLTKRRRTISISETSEPRKSHSEPSPSKDGKIKRGPGRPPKTERMLSNVSVGDEDVFVNDNTKQETKKEKREETTPQKSTSADQGSPGPVRKREQPTSLPMLRELWAWSGNSTKRPGLKGKAKKEYYKTVLRGKESISVGECAVFLSTGRPNLPYVGRIESFWEAWGGQMVVKVKWFYHPEETKGGKRLQNMKGALFRSDHEDENDCQTISHKCEVIPYADYKRRRDVISHDDNEDVYYMAGSYQPTIGHIKFEPGVVAS